MNAAEWFSGRARMHRRGRSPADRERGSAVIEAVIGVPAFMMFVVLIVFAGRVEIANQAVALAANEAARAASISRTQGQADELARTAATTALTNQQVNCLSSSVAVDTTAFASPVGTPATVWATVSCVVNLTDLSVPGVPGTRTVTATMSSPLDTYRER
ncbi:MAG TPA: TadE/TadG family type IV pilus assembly protein [Dermatophilaceae bacterium]|nr:TadE/TadG family type IV pilus assembly protein [Dermatophilaceae bacterium]